jgi:hypothetical protein
MYAREESRELVKLFTSVATFNVCAVDLAGESRQIARMIRAASHHAHHLHASTGSGDAFARMMG